MALTIQQRLFVAEFLANGGNATEAAKAAKYSERTAYAQGSRLLKHVEVAKAIEAGVAKREKKLALVAEELDQELACLAKSDIGDAVDETNDLLDVKKMPERFRRAVASIEVEQRREGKGEDDQPYLVKKVKLWDKGSAIGLAYKRLGLLKDRVEHEVKFSPAEILAEAWRRKQGGKP